MDRLIVICFLLLFWSCKTDKKQDNDNPVLGDEVVTFIVNGYPEGHSLNDAIYISGDFEGWSGGREQFKLKQEHDFYAVSIPKYRKNINFKFTKGNWDVVECRSNGNPIENRKYAFSKLKDTVFVTIANWNHPENQSNNATAAPNVQVFAEAYLMPQLDRKRKISIYLPPDYEASNESYPVLYMHDGQNVFDVSTSYAGEWEVDETLNKIYTRTGFGLIVVAIDHGGEKRFAEYAPWDHEEHGKAEGDAYLNFIVNNLKPAIDKTYRTKSDARNTAIMGSSLGGLITHYAAFKYPNVFGKAGVFSPSYWCSQKVFEQVKSNEKLSNSRLYFLMGGLEDDRMLPNFHKMIDLLKDSNFNSENLKKNLVPEGNHDEKLWRENFEDAITWLFQLDKMNASKTSKEISENIVGKLDRYQPFPSKYIKPRPVDVWLPEDYSKDKKYAVLYMHDGQMLFDSNATWNKQEWKVDEWASKLMKEGKTKDFIVVGIHNIKELRWFDLFPQKAFKNLKKGTDITMLHDGYDGFNETLLNGDNYLKFLVKELKPFIDSKYPVYTDRENTFVAGSSMGGLMSMYAISEYPDVFSRAACISTHWVGSAPIENNPLPEAIFKYMEAHLPSSKTHRLYFDYGTETLDAHYPQYAPRVDAILKAKGYTNTNSRNLKFEGTDHSENSWNQRLDIPLTFLLSK
ncbi:alpha/beta hydrolase-fold protein [Seonamhaeicola sp.]|uniref:alpha/beta hydrolase n=1 Tax=Seonamhaeicola sp. TaxID=1912245 RepID=UPI0026315D43|nr:alpha/beta hydrolase-fold protein [Seonamhaeicola sp.]